MLVPLQEGQTDSCVQTTNSQWLLAKKKGEWAIFLRVNQLLHIKAVRQLNLVATCTSTMNKWLLLRGFLGGFPGGAVVENLPANAGDTGSSPGLGRSHMPRSSWAREPQWLSLRVWSLCSATREAVTVRGPRTAMKSGPRSPPTRDSSRTETKIQHSQKQINKLIN